MLKKCLVRMVCMGMSSALSMDVSRDYFIAPLPRGVTTCGCGLLVLMT